MVTLRTTILKISTLTIVGLLVPLPVFGALSYAVNEFGPEPDWTTALQWYLPPAIACALFFFCAALASSLPRSRVTFVQALFLLVATFIITTVATLSVVANKSSLQPSPNDWSWIPVPATLCMFAALVLLRSGTPKVASSQDN